MHTEGIVARAWFLISFHGFLYFSVKNPVWSPKIDVVLFSMNQVLVSTIVPVTTGHGLLGGSGFVPCAAKLIPPSRS